MKVSKADIAQLEEHPVALRRITRLFAPHRSQLSLVVLLIIATSLISLVPPFITKALIDDAIPHHDVRQLLLLVGGTLAIVVVTQLFAVLQTWMSTRIGQRVMHALRTDLFTHLQRQPLSFFTRTRGGELQSRLTNDINGMQGVVTDSATSIASNVTTAIGTAAAMAVLSWRLSLISLVILPPAIYLSRRVARLRRTLQTKAQRTLAEMQTQIEESLSISGVMLAKTMGAGPTLSRRFADSSGVLTELELQSQLAGRWRMGTMAVIFAAIPALIYLAAGLPATGNGMTIGTLVAFTGLQSALFRPLMGVLNVGIQLTTSKALFSRIFEYLDLPVAISDPTHPSQIIPATAIGEVRFDGVTLRYPGADRNALTDVDLRLPAGATVAVVGSTGSGKSTLAALASRLHDPDVGRVTIDGIDLRDLTLDNVSSLVGVVNQETYLLHATIADNLRYAKADASDVEIIAAAKAAQVHDLIESLPEGYDTVVGARGYRFSGGEKQRIALARTILRNPRILVLDEATSALDNATERAVQDALEQLSRGRTTLTIAHRLSTVRSADLIVVLDHGRVVESGTHDELLAADGRYTDLVRAQEATPVTTAGAQA
ncbi:ABC transporter ATP-binding protein [Calidifontibacter terrae]